MKALGKRVLIHYYPLNRIENTGEVTTEMSVGPTNTCESAEINNLNNIELI